MVDGGEREGATMRRGTGYGQDARTTRRSGHPRDARHAAPGARVCPPRRLQRALGGCRTRPCPCCLPIPSLSLLPSFPLMASVSRLREVLSAAFSLRGLPNGEQEFFEELMAHRPQLVNLYDVGPRNPQEQRELESGAYGSCTYLLSGLTVDARENHD